ncbi:MAG: chemotaxis protein CheB, partial [Pseudomonas sp.]|uniref:chemotaxis protein CheB n=1 Tax=Pseudomonas sp. TaxID=306 RepID=UPI001219EBAB
IKAGRVYVAPPDLHMILEKGRVRLHHGPKENFTRPAVDPLFRSAAIEFGTRVVGIILTGRLDDGSAGLIAIKDRGGIAIVQDPAEAYADSMPRSAAACVIVDHVCEGFRALAYETLQCRNPRAPRAGLWVNELWDVSGG